METTEPLWQFTEESAWLLKGDNLFEQVAARGASVYGCKGCGARLPRNLHDAHRDQHQQELGRRERGTAVESGPERTLVGEVDDLVRRIVTMRVDEKKSYPAIASALNDEQVPTLGGGKQWYPVVVRSLYLRHTEEVAA